MDDKTRALRSAAAHKSWAQTQDRTARTAPARRALLVDRFEREVDPDGTLAPAERARRAHRARSEYFRDLSARAWQIRRERVSGDAA